MSSLFQKNKSYPVIRGSYYAIKYFHDMYNCENSLGSVLINKVLDGIKRISLYTAKQKTPITTTDLKKAFHHLGGRSMNLMNLRLMLLLVLSFMGFLRFSEVSKLRRSDVILYDTHLSIFIEKSKTDVYRHGHWLHLAKLNSELCPVNLTKRYFNLANISVKCDMYIFRGIVRSKNGYKLRLSDQAISYTTAREHVLDLLKNIGLDPKEFGLHSLRSGGATAAANLGVKDRLFKKHGRWKSEKVKDNYVHENLKIQLSVSKSLGL